jgi:hypothetical protein
MMPLLFLVFNCIYWLSFGGHLFWAMLEDKPIQATMLGSSPTIPGSSETLFTSKHTGVFENIIQFQPYKVL